MVILRHIESGKHCEFLAKYSIDSTLRCMIDVGPIDDLSGYFITKLPKSLFLYGAHPYYYHRFNNKTRKLLKFQDALGIMQISSSEFKESGRHILIFVDHIYVIEEKLRFDVSIDPDLITHYINPHIIENVGNIWRIYTGDKIVTYEGQTLVESRDFLGGFIRHDKTWSMNVDYIPHHFPEKSTSVYIKRIIYQGGEFYHTKIIIEYKNKLTFFSYSDLWYDQDHDVITDVAFNNFIQINNIWIFLSERYFYFLLPHYEPPEMISRSVKSARNV